MKLVKVNMQSASPIGFSKHYEVPKLTKESPADYEERTWRNRVHIDKEGQILITPMMIKNGYYETAAFLKKRIPGRGTATYAKHFLCGILVEKPIPLGIKQDEVEGEELFVPSDGIKGGGKRVKKFFPVIKQWSGIAEVWILDDTITKPVFELHSREMGRFIGMGFWRAGRGGLWGRFSVKTFEWQEIESDE